MWAYLLVYLLLSLEEVEAEKANTTVKEKKYGITQALLAWKLPEWSIGFQYSIQDANECVDNLVQDEYNAKVWNFTTTSDKDEVKASI